MQFGNREFDSLMYGDAVYREVASHLRALRRGSEFYPVYLTGVISAEGDAGGPCPLIDLLRLKRTVEERLVAAMQTNG